MSRVDYAVNQVTDGIYRPSTPVGGTYDGMIAAWVARFYADLCRTVR